MRSRCTRATAVLAPPEKASEKTVPDKGPSKRSRGALQAVTMITSPGGATSIMDGKPDTACTTPCSIDASPGRHTVTLNLSGYQLERRDVDVGSSPQELPAVVLVPIGGTLVLTSVPTRSPETIRSMLRSSSMLKT